MYEIPAEEAELRVLSGKLTQSEKDWACTAVTPGYLSWRRGLSPADLVFRR